MANELRTALGVQVDLMLFDQLLTTGVPSAPSSGAAGRPLLSMNSALVRSRRVSQRATGRPFF
jgi:hypothetical protein